MAPSAQEIITEKSQPGEPRRALALVRLEGGGVHAAFDDIFNVFRHFNDYGALYRHMLVFHLHAAGVDRC